MPRQPFDGRRVEQLRPVGQAPHQPRRGLEEAQGQIELRRPGGQRYRAQIETGQRQGGGEAGLHVEHGVEKRRARQVAGRGERLDQQLEGNVLVSVSLQSGLAHPAEQLAEPGIAGEPRA